MMLQEEGKVLLRHRQRQSFLALFTGTILLTSIADFFIQSSTARPESSLQSRVKAE